MKRFCDVSFESWFVNRMKSREISFLANAEFVYTIEKQTEKAICFRVQRKNDVFDKHFNVWAPKSAVRNLEEVLEEETSSNEDEETVEETKERLLTTVAKYELAIEKQVEDGVDQTSKEFKEQGHILKRLLNDYVAFVTGKDIYTCEIEKGEEIVKEISAKKEELKKRGQ